jgi:hypothetical protein
MIKVAKNAVYRVILFLDDQMHVAINLSFLYFWRKITSQGSWPHRILIFLLTIIIVSISPYIRPLSFISRLPLILSIIIVHHIIIFLLSIGIRIIGYTYFLARNIDYKISLLVLVAISCNLFILGNFIDVIYGNKLFGKFVHLPSIDIIAITLSFLGGLLYGADILKPEVLLKIDNFLKILLHWNVLWNHFKRYVVVDIVLLGGTNTMLLIVLFLIAYWFSEPAKIWMGDLLGNAVVQLLYHYLLCRFIIGLLVGTANVLSSILGLKVIAMEYQFIYLQVLGIPIEKEIYAKFKVQQWNSTKEWLADVKSDILNNSRAKRTILLIQIILFIITEIMDHILFAPFLIIFILVSLPFYFIIFICSLLASFCCWLSRVGPFLSPLRTFGLFFLSVGFLLYIIKIYFYS